MRFQEWLKGTSMTDLGSLAGIITAFLGSMILTLVARELLITDSGTYIGTLKGTTVDPNLLLSMTNAYISGRQTAGLTLTGILAGLWGFKGVTSAVGHFGNRSTAKEKYLAQADLERAKQMTQEHKIPEEVK